MEELEIFNLLERNFKASGDKKVQLQLDGSVFVLRMFSSNGNSVIIKSATIEGCFEGLRVYCKDQELFWKTVYHNPSKTLPIYNYHYLGKGDVMPEDEQ